MTARAKSPKSSKLKQQIKHLLKMPERYVYLSFIIDTNRVNARGNLLYMNQLEKWHNNDVVQIEVPEEAFQEMADGGYTPGTMKAKSYGRTIVTARMQAKYQRDRQKVESILFPSGARKKSERNDIGIVLNARHYRAILVTNDGDSKSQPNGILGNKAELAKLGIQVMRDSEAVELVKKKIKERDGLARAIAEKTGEALPQWVGVD
jgi:hypothetical protein